MRYVHTKQKTENGKEMARQVRQVSPFPAVCETVSDTPELRSCVPKLGSGAVFRSCIPKQYSEAVPTGVIAPAAAERLKG